LDEAGVTIEEYPGDVPFLVYTIDELGHHWPGGRGELNRRIAGPPSNLVDACAVIWEFFRSHGSRGI
jgi:polyhydroxybutyrate depolymerase